MKFKLVLFTGLAAAFSAHSHAADLGGSIKDKYWTSSPPAYSWTGLHVGANIGGVFEGEAETNTSSFSNDAPFKFSSLSSFSGGAQIGYDIEIDRWILGAEADFQWVDLEDRAVGDPTIPGDLVDGRLNWLEPFVVALGILSVAGCRT